MDGLITIARFDELEMFQREREKCGESIGIGRSLQCHTTDITDDKLFQSGKMMQQRDSMFPKHTRVCERSDVMTKGGLCNCSEIIWRSCGSRITRTLKGISPMLLFVYCISQCP